MGPPEKTTPGRAGSGAEVDELQSCAPHAKAAPTKTSRLREGRVFVAITGSGLTWAWAVVSEGVDVPPSLVSRRLASSRAEAITGALTVLSAKLPRRLMARIQCAPDSPLHRAVRRLGHSRIRPSSVQVNMLGRFHAENLAAMALKQLIGGRA